MSALVDRDRRPQADGAAPSGRNRVTRSVDFRKERPEAPYWFVWSEVETITPSTTEQTGSGGAHTAGSDAAGDRGDHRRKPSGALAPKGPRQGRRGAEGPAGGRDAPEPGRWMRPRGEGEAPRGKGRGAVAARTPRPGPRGPAGHGWPGKNSRGHGWPRPQQGRAFPSNRRPQVVEERRSRPKRRDYLSEPPLRFSRNARARREAFGPVLPGESPPGLGENGAAARAHRLRFQPSPGRQRASARSKSRA